jgi:hypothetical protein
MKCLARIVGRSDHHTVSKNFDDVADAQTWILTEGLREFSAQPAIATISDAGGSVLWTKSHIHSG